MAKDREWVILGNFGGYYYDDNHFVVCEEYGLSDADTDRYAVDVMNGDGYYDDNGKFCRYCND